MVITEIFKSIQGESTRAGLPCIFVRLTGCDLRCTWCDTAYAFYGGKRVTVDEVMTRVREFSGGAVKLVEITGGEPLLQEEIYVLCDALLAEGFTVMVETGGHRDLSRLRPEVIKIVDVKCPDSGEAGTFEMKNLDALTANDEVKFVIASRRDYEFARDFTAQHNLAGRVKQVLFSPVMADPEGKWPAMDAQALAGWILADNLPVRMQMQLHKFIWHPATKGV